MSRNAPRIASFECVHFVWHKNCQFYIKLQACVSLNTNYSPSFYSFNAPSCGRRSEAFSSPCSRYDVRACTHMRFCTHRRRADDTLTTRRSRWRRADNAQRTRVKAIPSQPVNLYTRLQIQWHRKHASFAPHNYKFSIATAWGGAAQWCEPHFSALKRVVRAFQSKQMQSTCFLSIFGAVHYVHKIRRVHTLLRICRKTKSKRYLLTILYSDSQIGT